MGTLQFGSEPTYDVQRETTSILKIAVASASSQQVFAVQPTFDPQMSFENCKVDVEENRLRRVVLQLNQLFATPPRPRLYLNAIGHGASTI